MLDLDFIRRKPEVVKGAVRAKKEQVDINRILSLDQERRRLITQTDTLRNRRNEVSDKIARIKKKAGNPATLIQAMRKVSEDIKSLTKELNKAEKELNNLLIWVPNILAPDVPMGGADQNQLIRRWGKHPEFDFTPRPHWEIGKELGILDLSTATKIAGSGFLLLKGLGASLERALINFMLDLHTNKHHYQEIIPPYLVNREAIFTTGQLPKLEQDMYTVSSHEKETASDRDDLFLIPTAEVPLTSILRNTTLESDDLPVYYVASTACFRREAGSYGKATRGIVRVHQFNKVELLKFVHPDTSFKELDRLVNDAEVVIQALGLEYRVMKLASGEMSFASNKTYDIEVWAPGLKQWLEVSSCSNFIDFQTRRAQIKFRDSDNKVKFVHTLNGSGVALPRTLICLLETYQQKDGSVIIPPVLRPYLNGKSRMERPK